MDATTFLKEAQRLQAECFKHNAPVNIMINVMPTVRLISVTVLYRTHEVLYSRAIDDFAVWDKETGDCFGELINILSEYLPDIHRAKQAG